MLTQVCDAESYLPIITACLDEAQVKKLKPRHMANFMALSAELFIGNYSMIADAFERNNGLEIGFKAKLAQEKDNVEIQFKPVDVFKDSASANLPDEDQEEFPFVKGSGSAVPAAAAATREVPRAMIGNREIKALPAPAVVDAETVPDGHGWPDGLAEETLVDYLAKGPGWRTGFLDEVLCDGTARPFVDYVLDNLDRLNEGQTIAFAVAMARNENSGHPADIFGKDTMELAELAIHRMMSAKKKADREKVLRTATQEMEWEVQKAVAVILLSESSSHPMDAGLRASFLDHVEGRVMDLDGDSQED